MARFITLTPDQTQGEPQKLGIRNELGWCACVWPGAVLVKQFEFDAAARYPDCGVNNEVYPDGPYLEIETLGRLERLEPGERTTLVERWLVSEGLPAAVMGDESRLERRVCPTPPRFVLIMLRAATHCSADSLNITVDLGRARAAKLRRL